MGLVTKSRVGGLLSTTDVGAKLVFTVSLPICTECNGRDATSSLNLCHFCHREPTHSLSSFVRNYGSQHTWFPSAASDPCHVNNCCLYSTYRGSGGRHGGHRGGPGPHVSETENVGIENVNGSYLICHHVVVIGRICPCSGTSYRDCVP